LLADIRPQAAGVDEIEADRDQIERRLASGRSARYGPARLVTLSRPVSKSVRTLRCGWPVAPTGNSGTVRRLFMVAADRPSRAPGAVADTEAEGPARRLLLGRSRSRKPWRGWSAPPRPAQAGRFFSRSRSDWLAADNRLAAVSLACRQGVCRLPAASDQSKARPPQLGQVLARPPGATCFFSPRVEHLPLQDAPAV
jgi:hypothetical protein